MRVWTGLLLALLSPLAGLGATGGPREPPSASVQYQALRAEYDRASSTGAPLTDAERLKFVGAVYRRRHALAVRFLELAERSPTDPVALDALIQAVWQVNTTPWPVDLVGEDSARERAFRLLQRDHLHSDRLGPLCERVSNGYAAEYEAFLRAVRAKNPHRAVQAVATLSLGHLLNNRRQRVELCREQPALAAEFAGLYGRDYLSKLLRRRRTAEVREAEAAFEEARKQYGDVALSDGETVAARAGRELFELRSLQVGSTAPEIEGEDQHGMRFRLSDYRGKVVLLDFWSFV